MKGISRNMALIDTHVHIDFYPNPLEIARQYESQKIYTMFVTNLPELYNKHYEQFSNYKYIRLCLGYHPQIVMEYDLNKTLFRECIKTTKYIGEVGLDFSGKITNKEKQLQINAFKFITSPEFNKGRIYTIHSRGAEDEVLEILKTNEVKHAIFHWYTGKISTLIKAIELGYYFSLNPKMLLTKNGKNIISKIPKDKILFETDGPFARVNKKSLIPSEIGDFYKLFGQEILDFDKLVFNNFRRILIEKDL